MKYIDVYININNRIGSGRGVADCRDIESHIYLFDRVAAVIILHIGATEVLKKGQFLGDIKIVTDFISMNSKNEDILDSKIILQKIIKLITD